MTKNNLDRTAHPPTRFVDLVNKYFNRVPRGITPSRNSSWSADGKEHSMSKALGLSVGAAPVWLALAQIGLL